MSNRTAGLMLILALGAGAVPAQPPQHLRACVDSCKAAQGEGRYDDALRHLAKAHGMAVQLKDSATLADVLVRRSGILMLRSVYGEALTDLQDALRINEAIGDEAGIATVLNSMGSVHFYARDPARARAYYLRSLAIRERIGNVGDIAMLQGNLGTTLEELGQPDSALQFHRRHLAMRLALRHASWIPVCHGNLGACFIKLGSIDSAIHYLTKSVEGSTGTPGLAHNREWALAQLGLAHLHKGDPRKAIALCSEALKLSQSNQDLVDQELCYQCLFKAHDARGDAPAALRMLKQWNLVRDTLLGSQREKEIMRSELLYGFERQQLADSLKRLDAQRREELAYLERIARERDQKRIFLFSAIGILLVAGGLWSRLRYIQRSRRAIKQERDRSDALLLNILPARIADELKATGRAPAREVQGVSILFTDFHEFTRLSERMSPTELVAEIDACFKAFDAIAARHRLEKIKTIGDAYMCAGGLPDPRPGSARDTVLAALEMQDWLMERGAQRDAQGLPFFRMRAGIHTGTVVAGIVGESKFQYDVWGDAVNTAARMEAAGEVGEVNISEATFLLIRDAPGLGFSPRGRLQAKGKGELAMFFARHQARHGAAIAPAGPSA